MLLATFNLACKSAIHSLLKKTRGAANLAAPRPAAHLTYYSNMALLTLHLQILNGALDASVVGESVEMTLATSSAWAPPRTLEGLRRMLETYMPHLETKSVDSHGAVV